MGSKTLAVVALSSTLVAASAAADYKGTYKFSTDVKEQRSNGKLEYILKLNDGGRADLSVKRSGNVFPGDDEREDYGDIVKYFGSNDTVTQTGSWQEDRNGVWIRFDRIRYGDSSERMDSFFRLSDDGGNLRLRESSTRFYGGRPDFRFQKDSGRKNNDALIAGLAVLAVGALVIANQHQGGGDEYVYDTQSDRHDDATLRFGNGARYNIDSLKFGLSKDKNTFYIDLRGSYAIQFRGTWEKSSRGYALRIKEVTVDGDRRDASGRGSIELNGSTPTWFSLDTDISSVYRSASVAFRPSRK